MADTTCLRLCYVIVVLLVSTLMVFVTHFSLDPMVNLINSQLSKTFYNRIDTYDPQASQGPDLVVRSVYFDGRQRDGYHNACVFMIEVRKHYVYRVAQLITGCLVGNSYTAQFKIHPIYINGKSGKLADEKPSLTHAMAMVDCFDIPAKNGSNATILYRTHAEGFIIPVESERPLFIPPLRERKGETNQIISCIAVVYGRPSFVDDWVRYQHEIGVNHVHMIAEDSFVDNGGLTSPRVKEALKSGFLSVIVWKARLKTNKEIHYHSQMLAYQDCVYRHQGTYDYMIITDQDDFFVPRFQKRRTLNFYIKQWCPTGACLFEWIEYYPDCRLTQDEGSPPGNLTSRLTSTASKRLPYTKSLYRLSDTVEVGIHDPREMMAGTAGVHVPSSHAYVAHLRTRRYPQRGQC